MAILKYKDKTIGTIRCDRSREIGDKTLLFEIEVSPGKWEVTFAINDRTNWTIIK